MRVRLLRLARWIFLLAIVGGIAWYLLRR